MDDQNQANSGGNPGNPTDAVPPTAPPPVAFEPPEPMLPPAVTPPPAVMPPPPPPGWGAPPPARMGAAPPPMYPNPQQSRPMPPPQSGQWQVPPPQPSGQWQQPSGQYPQPPQNGAYPPQYGPPQGYRPPGFQPPPNRRRNVPMMIGAALFLFFIVGGGLLVLAGALSSAGGAPTGSAGIMPFGSRIAILDVGGELGEGPAYAADTQALIHQVRQWQDNSSIKGIVVRVNSPGGAVSATQELHAALTEYRAVTSNPVVTSMGDIAASGGYYTAMATDHIFANPGTLTGSIGVILSFYDYQGLQDKVGLHSRTIKSGEFKDIGSGSRAMTAEERALLQETITDTYEQFLEAVVDNRKDAIAGVIKHSTGTTTVTPEQIEQHARGICDGRIFSGRQALELGMIDELGTLEDAVHFAASKAGISGEPDTVRGPIRKPTLFGAIESKLGAIDRNMAGSALLEYRASFQ